MEDEDASKVERIRAMLRQLRDDPRRTPSPCFDCCKGYDFQLVTAEQMRWLKRPKSQWTRPTVSPEFLRCRTA